jgi:hypothetical protein
VYRVFDPMFVIEEARWPHLAGSEALLRQFISIFSGGAARSLPPLVVGGRSYLRTLNQGDGFAISGLGYIDRNGFLQVMAIASANGEVEQRVRDAAVFFNSVSIRSPARDLSGPELAARGWFEKVRVGDQVALLDATCAQWRPFVRVARMSEMFSNTPRSGDLITAGARQFNFSNLTYQIVQSNGAVALVRIGGNVLPVSGGQAVPFYQFNRSGTNAAIMRFENGRWRHCDYLRGR